MHSDSWPASGASASEPAASSAVGVRRRQHQQQRQQQQAQRDPYRSQERELPDKQHQPPHPGHPDCDPRSSTGDQ